MSAVDIDVDVADTIGFVRAIIAATSGISLVAFLENQATVFFQDDIESRFEEEGDAKSGFWKPLADATIDIRRQYGFGDGPINVRTGEFKEFMLADYDVIAGGSFAEMNVPGSPKDPIIEEKLTTAQRGKIHNPIPDFGSTPARPVLAVSEMDLMSLVEMLELHIVQWAMATTGASVA